MADQASLPSPNACQARALAQPKKVSMNEPKPALSRRSVLHRGLLFVAGACGLQLASSEAPAAQSSSAPDGNTTTLRFYASCSRHHKLGQEPGKLPKLDGVVNRRGDLFDAITGKKVGEFGGTCLGSQNSFPAARAGGFSLELQTLRLEGGDLFGIGSGSEPENGHAILGGTGRFAGSKGSYLIRRSREEANAGSIEFVINLLS